MHWGVRIRAFRLAGLALVLLLCRSNAKAQQGYIGFVDTERGYGLAFARVQARGWGWYTDIRAIPYPDTAREGWSASVGAMFGVRSWVAAYAGAGVRDDWTGTTPRLDVGFFFRPHENIGIQLGYDLVQVATGEPAGSGTLGLFTTPAIAGGVLEWGIDLFDGPDLSEVHIGMGSVAVREEWGEPDHVQVVTTAAGRTEVWYYEDGFVVYIHDGRITAVRGPENE